MSFLLIAIAAATAANPARLLAVLPEDRRNRRRFAAASGGLLWLALAVLAGFSGPLINSVSVTSSSAIIAAGVALVVIGARDAIAAPPRMSGTHSWPSNVLVPVFFPTLFTPAIAMISVAAGADRGLFVGLAAVTVGVAGSILVALGIGGNEVLSKGGGLRAMASFIGLIGVAAGALVATRGVMSI